MGARAEGGMGAKREGANGVECTDGGCSECADLCDFSDALTVVARCLSLLVSRLSVLVVYLAGPGGYVFLCEWAAACSLLS